MSFTGNKGDKEGNHPKGGETGQDNGTRRWKYNEEFPLCTVLVYNVTLH